MPTKNRNKTNFSRLTHTSPHLSAEVCALLVETAQKTASRLNDEQYFGTLYLECIYLYTHILSRLVFYEFGGTERDIFISQCFEHLSCQLEQQLAREQLLSELRDREQYYCRYPCLEEHSTDIGFIAYGFNSLLLTKNLPSLLVDRATLLINDGCLLWLRRLASRQLRIHISPRS